MFRRFIDREEGGRMLAAKLADYEKRKDVIVLALPRGGVPVGLEIAKILDVPFDVFLVRKLGVPGREELAFGAIASGGATVFNESVIKTLRIPKSIIKRVIEQERAELKRRETVYNLNDARIELADKSVIIVDDGMATGATMKAAIQSIKSSNPAKIIIAVPVSARGTCEAMEKELDVRCICTMTPKPFLGVGLWYSDFHQISDEEVYGLIFRRPGAKPKSLQTRFQMNGGT